MMAGVAIYALLWSLTSCAAPVSIAAAPASRPSGIEIGVGALIVGNSVCGGDRPGAFLVILRRVA